MRESLLRSEFLQKMAEAKKLEKEAVLSLLPESIREHADVIEREMKAILIELVLHMQNNEQQEKTEKVKKVDIN